MVALLIVVAVVAVLALAGVAILFDAVRSHLTEIERLLARVKALEHRTRFL